jgi:RNA polymerase primary sigma factor
MTEERSNADYENSDGHHHPMVTDVDKLRSQYLHDITRTPLLSAEEEVTLTGKIHQARKARKRIAGGDLSLEEQREAQRYIQEGTAARERLMMANTRLVVSVASRYQKRGLPFIDLVQEGIIGLIRAIEKFDPERGNRFSTYATWWIRQAITRGLANNSRTIRLPVHRTTEINRLGQATHKLTQELGREPTLEELAQFLDTTPEKIQETIQYAQTPISLELPQDDDEDRLLGDLLEDREATYPEDAVSQIIMEEQIQDVLLQLPPREAQVLKLRYGLQDGTSYKLQQVGERMGITRERVRQIESQALSRLRRRARKLR